MWKTFPFTLLDHIIVVRCFFHTSLETRLTKNILLGPVRCRCKRLNAITGMHHIQGSLRAVQQSHRKLLHNLHAFAGLRTSHTGKSVGHHFICSLQLKYDSRKAPTSGCRFMISTHWRNESSSVSLRLCALILNSNRNLAINSHLHLLLCLQTDQNCSSLFSVT